MTILLALWNKIGGYVVAVLGVLGILAAAYSKGKSDQKVNQKVDDLKSIKAAKEIEDEVDNLGSNDIDAEYVKWLRDSDR